jgi:putative nucleotidyltransferase with HDIG domain
MLDSFNKWLYNCVYYRYVFYVFLSLSVLSSIVFPQNESFFILYILSAIFLGIGFYNKAGVLLVFSVLLAFGRVFISHSDENAFLIFLTYFLLTVISAVLTKNIERVRKDSLELQIALINALDTRDPYTYNHSENVSRYAVQIAKKMKLSKDKCEVIRIGALLHDIGKIGVPEHILSKPGKLTEDEYITIMKHTKIGYQMLQHIERFKNYGILDIILYHHERFDGKGYPAGLRGSEIPLSARIVAVADSYHAMISKRVYRNEFNLEMTLNEIRQNKGTQFDPEIVDAFLSLFNEKGEIQG